MSVWSVSINSRRKLSRQPRQKLLLRQPSLLLQCGQHIRPDSLLKLRGWKVFIRSLADPGLCGISLAVLFEAFEQFSEPATQEPADPTACEPATQIAKQAAQLSLLVACTGLGTARALKQFRKLVPVLITRQSEQPNKAVIDGNPRDMFTS